MATSTRAEYLRQWHAENPGKAAEYARRARAKNRPPCRVCGEPLPYPSRGAKYCSDDCRKVGKRAAGRRHWERAYDRLSSYKLARGCDRCGYARCPAALDFHHANQEDKAMRITAKQFAADSDATRAELEKCELLCANCHREHHYLERQSAVRAERTP